MYFSRNTKNLLIIPKNVVDKFIFNKLYQQSRENYTLKCAFEKFDYNGNRLSLNFRKSDDNYVFIYAKAKRNFNQENYVFFKLPPEFWNKISFKTERYKDELIEEITKRNNKLSENNNTIVPIELFGEIESFL